MERGLYKLLIIVLLLGCQKEDMDLLLFFGQSVVPFDDTIEFNEDSIVDNAPYYIFLGNYLRNPVNDKVLYLYRFSDEHLMDTGSKVSGKISTDKGQTFASEFDIYDPSVVGVNEPGVGYDSNGKLHFFVSVRDDTDLDLMVVDELRYFFSNNDGSTINTPVIIPYPSDGLLHAWPTGRMIENNGVLLKNYYRQDAAIATESANYLLRSTDGGSNWATITIRVKGSAYYNEADIIALSNTDLLVTFRDEDNGGWQQYRSDDNGLTWSNDGNIKFGESLGGIPRPPSLRSFKINNQLVIAFYSFNDSTNKHFVVYAKATDLISSGLSGWNTDTKIILQTTNTNLGYNNEVHFDNTLEAILVTHQANAVAGTKSHFATLPTTQYDSLITELGL